jgi:ubiquinone/menaquinone biosynthesis C-methylase UbiE
MGIVSEVHNLQPEWAVLLEKFQQKLNSLNMTGIELSTRILSCIHLLRDLEQRFYNPGNPCDYLEHVVNQQITYIETMQEAVRLQKIEHLSPLKEQRFQTQDELHKYLFNKTWKTLELSGDPLNDYRPYMDLIHTRLDKNGFDLTFFHGKRCLDVGCGTGRFTLAMAQRSQSAEGLDPGDISIEYAEKFAEILKLENASFRVGNAYDLPYSDESFDFVVCNGVLHHLDYPDQALSEIYRVLKPSGHFWLYVEGSGGIIHAVWDIIQRSFEGVSLSETYELIEALRIPNLHFWMDIFFAKYNFISVEKNKEQLEQVGFHSAKRLLGAEKQDYALELFENDSFRTEKFGYGGIRVIVEK